MMKKIAICIPTFNRPNVVFDTCTKILDIIDNDLADIYIYDSSTDDETEKLLKGIEQDNFFYKRIDPSIHSSKKVYDIYQDRNIQDDYEYLWILADYLFFHEIVIRAIKSKLNEKWDMLMIDFRDLESKGNRQYFSPDTIFYEFAWSMTQFGIMIVNCGSVLKKADWRYLEEKYLVDKHKNFSHLAMYFEMMLKIYRIRFYHFSIERENVYISEYRKKISDYFDDFLYVWGHCWYHSIKALPQYYTRKDHVIKTECIYGYTLGEMNIAKLKLRGVLSAKNFWKYIPIWHCVSTVPISFVYGIIFMPDSYVKDIIRYGSIKEWKMHVFSLIIFRRFCRKHKKIYLYGAGIKAKRLAEFMMDQSIRFEGFLVTDINDNTTWIKDHIVLGIAQLKKDDDMGIILAVNDKNKREIVPILDKMGYKNVFKLNLV